jgi:hypothetical protein
MTDLKPTKMKKVTKATVKSFINKNIDNLLINVKSSFDGMTDCCEPLHEGFKKATKSDSRERWNLGIEEAWFVGQSRDYFTTYETSELKGYEVSNCCGHFIIAIEK